MVPRALLPFGDLFWRRGRDGGPAACTRPGLLLQLPAPPRVGRCLDLVHQAIAAEPPPPPPPSQRRSDCLHLCVCAAPVGAAPGAGTFGRDVVVGPRRVALCDCRGLWLWEMSGSHKNCLARIGRVVADEIPHVHPLPSIGGVVVVRSRRVQPPRLVESDLLRVASSADASSRSVRSRGRRWKPGLGSFPQPPTGCVLGAPSCRNARTGDRRRAAVRTSSSTPTVTVPSGSMPSKGGAVGRARPPQSALCLSPSELRGERQPAKPAALRVRRQPRRDSNAAAVAAKVRLRRFHDAHERSVVQGVRSRRRPARRVRRSPAGDAQLATFACLASASHSSRRRRRRRQLCRRQQPCARLRRLRMTSPSPTNRTMTRRMKTTSRTIGTHTQAAAVVAGLRSSSSSRPRLFARLLRGGEGGVVGRGTHPRSSHVASDPPLAARSPLGSSESAPAGAGRMTRLRSGWSPRASLERFVGGAAGGGGISRPEPPPPADPYFSARARARA